MTAIPAAETRSTPASGASRSMQRARVLRENLTAYLFLAPAMILILIFGVLPVGFALFVSLHQWRRFPGEYLGLAHYAEALGGFGYIGAFWLALGALAYALYMLYRLATSKGQRLGALSHLVPGAATSAGVLLLINWVVIWLPLVLDIPQRLRQAAREQGAFIRELVASFQSPAAAEAGTQMLAVLVVALILAGVWALLFRRSVMRSSYLLWATMFWLGLAIGVLTLQLTVNEVNNAIVVAQANGGELPIWTQTLVISAGVGLLAAGWLLWRRGVRQIGEAGSDRNFALLALAGVLLAGGGVLLITEVPRALSIADPDVLSGFSITTMFALGTIPVQLTVGLGLAYLLFQKIRGRAFFRVVYFLPYIMPFVATSIVFTQIFSTRPGSLANQFIGTFGIEPQTWLSEPEGIFQLIFGDGVPGILAGPSLALVVIMIYTIWTYIGYNTVIFLAGLGNIPPELYEAARIDGANNWQVFRHVTLPLLSPTTFFLSLIAIIGTFQAFTQIWIMRTPAAGNSVDTIGVYIFENIRSNNPNMGYGSALSLVLFVVILALTIIQQRVARDRVFYS